MRYVAFLLVVHLLLVSCGGAWAIDRELPVVDKVVRVVTDRLPFGDSHGRDQEDVRGLVFILLLVLGAGILAWMLSLARAGQFGKVLLLMSLLALVVWLFVPIIPIFLLVPLFAFGGCRLARRPRYAPRCDVHVQHVTVFAEAPPQCHIQHVVVPHVVMINQDAGLGEDLANRPIEADLYHVGSTAPNEYEGHAPYPDYVLPTRPDYPEDGTRFPDEG